jgi:putative transposase
MPNTIHRQHPTALKTKVALDAIKEVKTLAELASTYGVHTTQIRRWKEVALKALANCFSEVQRIRENNQEELILTLYQQIGQLKVELDWLKKKLGIIESR